MSDPRYVHIGRASTKLVEECAELIKAVCKAERFGWARVNPVDKVPNIRRIREEIKDVIYAINILEKYIEDNYEN